MTDPGRNSRTGRVRRTRSLRRLGRDPALHPQHPAGGKGDRGGSEGEEGAHLGGVLRRAGREGDARNEERDGKADGRDAADDEEVAVRIPAGSPSPSQRSAMTPKSVIPSGLPMMSPASTSQVASPIAENSTPALARPKKKRITSTGVVSACSVRLRRSGRRPSSSAKMPNSMSACGIAGMTGRRPSAGWMPACWKPYQLIAPATA